MSSAQRRQDAHEAIADVDGWLLPGDVDKLYELAFSVAGPILEIGTFHGRSAIVMARALRDAGNPAPLVSLDVDPEALGVAGENLRRKGVAGQVTLVRGTLAAFFRAVSGFVPALVFVDGDHSAAGAARDLSALEPHVPDGGLLFLHDYADVRDRDPAVEEFGVGEAVARTWVGRQCEPLGVFGVGGLFRRRIGGPGSVDGARRPPVVDLVWRDDVAMQFRQRIRWPLGRRLRRVMPRRRPENAG
ncbi:MAG TPA: class I SAM-dependent methyltransferase [Solirubrobacteraceae bacterium]|nr:class I SAM-dependent methyltransferase [Solirubrobacteraceae bacterium]